MPHFSRWDPCPECIVFSHHCLCFLLSQAAGRGWCTRGSNQLRYRPQHSARHRNVAYTACLGIAVRTLLSPVSFPSRARPHSLGNAETSEKLCTLGKKDHWWATEKFYVCLWMSWDVCVVLQYGAKSGYSTKSSKALWTLYIFYTQIFSVKMFLGK